MAEWLKAPDSKSGVGASLPEVRILSPSANLKEHILIPFLKSLSSAISFIIHLDWTSLTFRLFCCAGALADQDRRFVIAWRSSSMAKGFPMTASTGLSASPSFSR